MRSATLRFGVAIMLGLAACGSLRSEDRVDSPASATSATDDASFEDAINSALDKRASVELEDVELRKFVSQLSDLTGQLCLIDRRALEDVGISDDVPLTFRCHDMKVRNFLNHILRPLDLTWTIQDGALVITTPEEAESGLQRRVFDIADLARPLPNASEEVPDYDSLIELLTSTICPYSWDAVGGPGSLEPFRGGLVVSQTRDVLEGIENVLAQIRKARKLAEQHLDSPPPTTMVGPGDGNPNEAKIERALQCKVVADFSDSPLCDVAEQLSESCGIHVILDSRAMDDVGIPPEVPVTLHADQIQVRHALRHILRALDLTTVVRGEALIITTPEEAESQLVSVVYPVADLLGRAGEADQFGDRDRPMDLDSLIQLVTSSVARDTWEDVGGPGSIGVLPHIDVLVISQTNDVHDFVSDLLARARRHLAAQPVASEEQSAVDAPVATRLVIYSVPSADTQRGQSGKSRDKSTKDQSSYAVPRDAILSQMGMGGMGGMGGFGGGGAPIATVDMSQAVIPESQLLGTIIELVEPDSWADRDDVYAKVLPGRLMIRHTDAVHRKVQRLLDKLSVPYRVNAGMGPPVSMGGGRF